MRFSRVEAVEFPDGESTERWLLAFERECTRDVEHYEVFEAEEYFEVIEGTTG